MIGYTWYTVWWQSNKSCDSINWNWLYLSIWQTHFLTKSFITKFSHAKLPTLLFILIDWGIEDRRNTITCPWILRGVYGWRWCQVSTYSSMVSLRRSAWEVAPAQQWTGRLILSELMMRPSVLVKATAANDRAESQNQKWDRVLVAEWSPCPCSRIVNAVSRGINFIPVMIDTCAQRCQSFGGH